MATFMSLLASLAILSAASPSGGTRAATVPTDVDLSARYLFYLHGAIVEGRGSGVEHPRFGAYEYDEIADRFAASGWVVISEVRESGTRVDAYAEKVVRQLESLLGRGVPADRIAVMGHSKGGSIALRVSSLLQRDDLRFVILAACFPRVSWQELNPKGRFLSIYDAADEIAGSCLELGAGADQVKEIRIELGEGHGLFFHAGESWVEPTLAWLR